MENPDIFVRITTSLSAITWDWAMRCFGEKHVRDVPIRALRLAEEAIETAQACGVDKAKLHELVDIVCGRPRGRIEQELGGVALTLDVLCTAANTSTEEVFLAELRRVLAKPPEHFAKRNDEKVAMGLVVR
jgi:NTP pyrophosphatase (non-canonical NTP hydrolase)